MAPAVVIDVTGAGGGIFGGDRHVGAIDGQLRRPALGKVHGQRNRPRRRVRRLALGNGTLQSAAQIGQRPLDVSAGDGNEAVLQFRSTGPAEHVGQELGVDSPGRRTGWPHNAPGTPMGRRQRRRWPRWRRSIRRQRRPLRSTGPSQPARRPPRLPTGRRWRW